VAVAVVAIGVYGWMRVGMLDLPSVPSSLSLEDTGLADLERYRQLDGLLRSTDTSLSEEALQSLALDADTRQAVILVRAGLQLVRRGQEIEGLESLRQGVRRAPQNLVLGNAYRMTVFQLQRESLHQASAAARLAPAFPQHLQGQPIRFLEALVEQTGVKEVRLQLALAWVDQMLLFPALEIKAPSSVESVQLLSRIIDESPGYVPALFARGLNHLHRPARLVWPESEKTPPDAAARDIGQCIAIGRQFDVGTPRLRAILALSLGDAYVKAGRYGVARSWWQIAQNLCHDDDIQSMVRRRYSWGDEEVLDRLEEDLDRARSHIEDPMTDLAFVWS
jgi:hypothetical protein